MHGVQVGAPVVPKLGNLEEAQLARLRDVASRYEISQERLLDLQILINYDIVFIADDSGSMNSKVKIDPFDPFSRTRSRWDELKETVKKVVELSTCFDDDGIDIYFLNNGTSENIFSLDQINQLFDRVHPGGYTPLTETFRQAMADKNDSEKKKVLIVIATDGQPTTRQGQLDINSFTQALLNKDHSRYHVAILACTEDENDVAYLDSLDDTVPRLDVCDDYASEAKQCLEKTNTRLSHGDYLVKCLLGPVLDKYDLMDASTAPPPPHLAVAQAPRPPSIPSTPPQLFGGYAVTPPRQTGDGYTGQQILAGVQTPAPAPVQAQAQARPTNDRRRKKRRDRDVDTCRCSIM